MLTKYEMYAWATIVVGTDKMLRVGGSLYVDLRNHLQKEYGVPKLYNSDRIYTHSNNLFHEMMCAVSEKFYDNIRVDPTLDNPILCYCPFADDYKPINPATYFRECFKNELHGNGFQEKYADFIQQLIVK